jgi:hypothetical protein
MGRETVRIVNLPAGTTQDELRRHVTRFLPNARPLIGNIVRNYDDHNCTTTFSIAAPSARRAKQDFALICDQEFRYGKPDSVKLEVDSTFHGITVLADEYGHDAQFE